MDVGIFVKIFQRPTLEDTLDAVCAQGIRFVQFNLSCAGLPTMPDEIPDALVRRIRRAFDARGLTMTALSGTYNMIHPDPAERETGLRRVRVLAQACAGLGVNVISVCTGTRDARNMWRAHPDNDTPAAWHDLVSVMWYASAMAEETDIRLGIEPELSNVVNSARKARRLLDEIGSPALCAVMDGSNLLRATDVPRMHAIFKEAFDLLGKDIAVVHAKDLLIDGSADHGAAGTGVLDYDDYLANLRRAGFDGPLILHTLEEGQVPQSVAFLRQKIAALPAVA